MAFLIGVIILITFLVTVYIIVKIKLNRFTRKYFGTTDIKSIIEKEKLNDEEIPKSLSGLDNLYLDQIKRDFKDLNINELKSEAEKVILECFNSIEKKNIKYLKVKNEKIKEFVISKIEDTKINNSLYKNIKIHKTVISKYENKKGVATIYFQTAFQYDYKEKESIYRLKQDRITTEYIYVIDETRLSKNIKAVGLNCPNCGAPITTLNDKKCLYCGSGIIDLVKKSFVINNIENK